MSEPETRPRRSGREEINKRSRLECKDKSLAQQNQKLEADINEIVRRFGLTGQLPVNNRIPIEADFDDILTYQDAMNAVRAADENFAALPADIRARFNNDPAQYISFCTSSDAQGNLTNLPELRKLGLAAEPTAAEAPGAAIDKGGAT